VAGLATLLCVGSTVIAQQPQPAKPAADGGKPKPTTPAAKAKNKAKAKSPGEINWDKEAASKVPPITDQRGNVWTIAQAGTVSNQSGLSSGAVITINGGTFSAGRTSTSNPKTFICEGVTNEVKLRRYLTVDHSRGAVFYVDQFRSANGKDMKATIVYTHRSNRDWDTLLDSTGFLVGERLHKGQFGIVARQADDSSSQSFFVVVRGAENPIQPTISSSSNDRLMVTLPLNLKGNEPISLAHWIGSIPNKKTADPNSLFSDFVRRKVLIAGQVPEGFEKQIANFDVRVIKTAPSMHLLSHLNSRLKTLRMNRGTEALLWLGPDSMLNGKLIGEPLRVATELTEQPIEVGLSDVAGITGGGGIGRTPIIYLRNGTVLRGEVETSNLRAEGADWAMDLDINTAQEVFGAVEERDGAPTENASFFVEINDGTVTDLAPANSAVLPLQLAWGAANVPLSNIISVRSVLDPMPHFEIRLLDGGQLNGFIGKGTIEGFSGLVSEPIKIDANRITALWNAGSQATHVPETVKGPTPVVSSIDISDLAKREEGDDRSPLIALHLRGDSKIKAKLIGDDLGIISGTSETKITAAQLVALDALDEDDGRFDVELRGGEVITGRLTNPVIRLQIFSDQEIDIPGRDIIGLRSIE